MDILTLLSELEEDGAFRELANDPRVQFGGEGRAYLGATILPERRVPENKYTETDIRYRTVIANDGSRYSPAQKKGSGAIIGVMEVAVGNQDIAREFTGREYDMLLDFLDSGDEMEAIARLIRWTDQVIVRPLVELIEWQRWQAIVNAEVVRVGDNGFREVVAYPDPAGHRAAVADVWTDITVDPFEDIITHADLLRDKGFEVNRIVTTRRVVSVMANNPNVRSRVGSPRLEMDASGAITGARYARASLEAINNELTADGLPNIETYDLTYRTLTGTGRFLPAGTMVMLATTGLNEEVLLDPDDDDTDLLLRDTVGYVAVGRPVGASEPGRVVIETPHRNKPPRIEAEGWQSTLPVIREPEAIGVLTGIHA